MAHFGLPRVVDSRVGMATGMYPMSTDHPYPHTSLPTFQVQPPVGGFEGVQEYIYSYAYMGYMFIWAKIAEVEYYLCGFFYPRVYGYG
jgi:hypothetical protein